MRQEWGHERQPSPSRRSTHRLRPDRRPPGHRRPRLHGIDRHPGHRPGPAQSRPLPRHRALRRRRQGGTPRRAGAAAAGPYRRGRAGGHRARAAGGAQGALRYGRAAAGDPRGPRRGHRAGGLRLPHRPQRHHRLHRPRPHPRRPHRGPDPRSRQQGIADRRRPPRQGRGEARPDHPGRLRARRALPGAGRRHPRRCAQAGRDGLRRALPRPYTSRTGPGHPPGRPRASDLVDGPGDHGQFGDLGQQGARSDRGTSSLRHSLRTH